MHVAHRIASHTACLKASRTKHAASPSIQRSMSATKVRSATGGGATTWKPCSTPMATEAACHMGMVGLE